ncbi:unnamed protein product [Medioppia subpectinata]|uniref:Cupin type-1 domain-containing protein n=1 Tax=Medioppia subpectinata TaxID=1979941 RepID=A0A7R9KS59_9ACAR|nr:unnamed protein product [Medioppia subpectinata]CAG2108826.1 unnamed protein product [Medioppia subpectinata]
MFILELCLIGQQISPTEAIKKKKLMKKLKEILPILSILKPKKKIIIPIPIPIPCADVNLVPFTNLQLEHQNPSSTQPPVTDAGSVPPFKYPFAFSRTAYYSGGWTRQVTVRELPLSRRMAGVQMRLIKGGVREMHWHVTSEWAYVIQGTCRITAVDDKARSFVEDVGEGDLWLFPGGIPHSLQVKLPVIACCVDIQNHVQESTFDNLPQHELYIFASELPRPLMQEKEMAAEKTGEVPQSYAYFASAQPANATRWGGSAKIIDKRNFPVTDIAAVIITLKPGGLRELHWHPNSDEWNYCVSGRVTNKHLQ